LLSYSEEGLLAAKPCCCTKVRPPCVHIHNLWFLHPHSRLHPGKQREV
jgi:hypothetical protein